MAIPDFQTCMLPLLRTIQDGKEWSMKDITNELSDEFDLTPEEREGLIPSGNARVVVNRVGWAKMYLKEAGLLESVRRGIVKITDSGTSVLAENLQAIDMTFLERFPSYREFRERRSQSSKTPESESLEAEQIEMLTAAFAEFRSNPVERLRVRIRTERARQIRELVADPVSMDLDTFNSDVWNFESSTLLDGEEIKGHIFPPARPDEALINRLKEGLDRGVLELHGNYSWAARVYGPMLKVSPEEKLQNVQTALRFLNDGQIPPIEKAKQIQDVPGFGANMATGLVALMHPEQFAISNKQSKAALTQFGYKVTDLSAFQEVARLLRDELGANDFIELDWFLFLFNQQPDPGEPSIENDEVRYWAINLGEGSRLWPQCQSDGIVAIGWDYLGDFRQYGTKEQLTDAIAKHRADGRHPMNDALACYQFAYEMKPGDYVLSKQGMSQLFGCGVIEGDYEFDPDRTEYRSIRRVRWFKEGSWKIPDDARVPLKTLTEVTEYRQFMAFARPIITDEVAPPPLPLPPREPFTIEMALRGLFISESRLKEMLDSLSRKKNVILQGPPGVGKTYISRRLAYALIGTRDKSKLAMVQFHQSYAYEDFIQGWRPQESGGFERRNGVFYEFCRRAEQDQGSNYVFLIDEINRGNLSKIFGELLMLIEADKRGPDYSMPLTYAENLDDQFFVPPNVHIIGVMNTADRSLAMVDYALRRRFTFVDLRPEFETDRFREFLDEQNVDADVVNMIIERMSALNDKIRSEKTNLGPGFEIGHSFFCPHDTEDELGMDWYRSVVKSEIGPLLREYWFDDTDKAGQLIEELLA
ncbi:MAG: winged helix-turn-helix domain-containing protein [Planctomycetales bacterium]|jgi:MoxR-like ATPase